MSVAICAICFEDARPIFEDLQCISACGHVFHELCLQQWMKYCPAGRDPTCPLCKRPISCPAHDVHRLYFQSAGIDSTQPQVSPSRNLQTAVEDSKHVESNFQSAEKAEAAIVVARSELAQCRQGLKNVLEELVCCLLEREKVQEEIQVLAKVLASHEQARWDRFFRLGRVLRVLREDRENRNLLEARVQELIELASSW